MCTVSLSEPDQLGPPGSVWAFAGKELLRRGSDRNLPPALPGSGRKRTSWDLSLQPHVRPVQKLLNQGLLWLPQDRKEGRHAAKQEEEEPPCASLRSGGAPASLCPSSPRGGCESQQGGDGPGRHFYSWLSVLPTRDQCTGIVFSVLITWYLRTTLLAQSCCRAEET